MNSTALPTDVASLRERVLNVIARLLEESGNPNVVRQLSLSSNLDTDLGLKSIERVELLGRLEIEFRVTLPQYVIAEVKTPEDLVQVLLTAPSADEPEEAHPEPQQPFVPGYPISATGEKSPGKKSSIGRKIFAGFLRVLEGLYGIYFGILLLIWIVPCWFIVLFMRDRHTAGRFTVAILRPLFFLMACPVRVVGREHMQIPGPKIFAANHTSYFDVLPLMMALGVDYRFVAKKEVLHMPFIGTFLRRMGHLSFNRGSARSRLRQLDEMQDLLRRGESIFMFPEGTFTPEDGIRPFHLGAFKASLATGAPIIPVSLNGTREFLRDGTFLPRPTKVTITISTPIYPRFTAAEGVSQAERWKEIIRLKNETRAAIAQHVSEPVL